MNDDALGVMEQQRQQQQQQRRQKQCAAHMEKVDTPPLPGLSFNRKCFRAETLCRATT